MPGRAPIVTTAALTIAVISLAATGCGGSTSPGAPEATETTDTSQTTTTESSETIDSPYGTTPVSDAKAAWRAALEAEFDGTVVAVRCYRSLADDYKTIDPNYFECGSDLKDASGSAFSQDGSVLCEPKCIGHVGVGRGAYDD